MPKVISANRLADGIVVYVGRDGSWPERLSQAKIFASKAEAEAGLLVAQNDAKRNLVVEPVVVEVTQDASGCARNITRGNSRAGSDDRFFAAPACLRARRELGASEGGQANNTCGFADSAIGRRARE